MDYTNLVVIWLVVSVFIYYVYKNIKVKQSVLYAIASSFCLTPFPTRFFHFHFHPYLPQHTPQMDVQQTSTISKNNKKTLTKSNLEIMPAKTISKV